MNDQKNQANKQEDAPKSQGGPEVKASTWKRLLAKRWVFPATYVAAAAIILTIMWVYQNSAQNDKLSSKDLGLTQVKEHKTTKGDAIPVTAKAESMQWPADKNLLNASVPYYESGADNEVRQAAMVQYEDTFTPHMGVDFSREDGQTFDVVAALSGKVTLVDKHPIVGYQVEITHDNGLKTIYESLSSVKVKLNDEVHKGSVIASAGRNELEKSEGVHLHFEVKQDGKSVNPASLIDNAADRTTSAKDKTDDQTKETKKN